MQLRFLTDLAELDAHFGRLAPLLEQVVQKAAHGEFSVKDLHRLAQHNKIILGMVEQEARVQLVFAFEFIAYPRFTAVNILALGGRGIAEAFAKFSAGFKAWCREAGAQKIQGSCRPAMARLLRQYGFLNVYQTMHCNL